MHDALAGLEVDMGDAVEDHLAGVQRVGGEIAVAVGKPGAAFVEAREFARHVVDPRLLDRVGLAGDIE